MAETVREFDLGDVLSITTGRLVSPRHIDGVYDILNHIMGCKHWTHQLGRAAEQAKPWILEQHPQLAEVDCSACTTETWQGWLAWQVEHFGERLAIRPLPGEYAERHDPLRELEEMVGKDRVIVVYAPEEGETDD